MKNLDFSGVSRRQAAWKALVHIVIFPRQHPHRKPLNLAGTPHTPARVHTILKLTRRFVPA
ncbi:MAG: hypothetical protein HY671_02615 [Chloroflexi bacterium]|nr:hypothetical protein [Chloroflexota bacterium]